jgi:hypothetical protein
MSRLSEDTYLGCRYLVGEGRWCYAERYVDKEGVEYEIWQDYEGEEMIMEGV